MPEQCPLCRSFAPAHTFGCWTLLSSTPAGLCATEADVVLMAEVRIAHALAAKELGRIASACNDGRARRSLQRVARVHKALASAASESRRGAKVVEARK